MTKISALSTTCKNCLFAKYDGNTQVSCELNRIEKIKSHPVYELVEATDNIKNFYVLNYHLCLYQRVSGWVHDKNSMEEMIDAVKEEIKMKWGAILILRDEQDNDMSRVEQRLNELFNQEQPPSWIGIVNQNPDMDVYWIINYLNNKDVIWQIQSSEEDTDREAIDILLDKMKKKRFVFYTVVESDKDINEDFYTKIHRNVLDELLQYSVIKDEDKLHQMIVNKIAHFKFVGNTSQDLEIKIKNQAGEHNLLVEYKNLL